MTDIQIQRRYFPKKKVCRFCEEDIIIDYKNPNILRSYINERCKILPRRATGTCARHQRELSREIKRARILALIPFTSIGKKYIGSQKI